jgi:WhiB family redox-sensing transcriptional regulator
MSIHSPAAIASGSESSGAVASGPWQERAACRFCPAELFFPTGTTGNAVDDIAGAKEICATCDVRGECLDYALRTNQEFGIWGGFDEEQRRRFRPRHAHGVPRGQTVRHVDMVVLPPLSHRPRQP